MGGKRETYTGFWCVDLRARPLGRPRRRWKDIKIDKEVDRAGYRLDWTDMAQDNMLPALVSAE
jgi:hypothetical protein